MMDPFKLALLVLTVSVHAGGEPNPYLEALKLRPWKSEHGYLEVRLGVFLFYWLYYADGTPANATDKPLVIWIQGGPGLAATGIANFEEIGPLDHDMKPRNHTWVIGRNLLLIDHPVGTGFSYATNESLYVRTDREAATDLSIAIKLFLRSHKKFRKTPTYLFSQSYGSKLTPRLAYYLHSAIKKSSLIMNLKGIGLGSTWVNPKESVKMDHEFMYQMGYIDRPAYLSLKKETKKILRFIEHGQYRLADKFDRHKYMMHLQATNGLYDFNNVNKPSGYKPQLSSKVNKYVKPTIEIVNQNITWSYYSYEVSDKLRDNLLLPSTKFVEMLLNETKIKVAVYNGNLDAVTPIAGAVNWVHNLNWEGARHFEGARRSALRGIRNGFYKCHDRLSLWWVFGAGHWVPEDNPEAMEQILQYVIDDQI